MNKHLWSIEGKYTFRRKEIKDKNNRKKHTIFK